MPDALSSPLDLHKRLTDIAVKAVSQVKANPKPSDAVLPPDLPAPATPDPPYQR